MLREEHAHQRSRRRFRRHRRRPGGWLRRRERYDGAGNLYVADTNANSIRKVVPATGAVTTVVGATAGISYPFAVVGDGAGNLYVADGGHRAIEKVVIATGGVTLLATAGLAAPTGITGDGAGNLYVADGNTIRKIATATATVSTVVGSPGRIGVTTGALPASLNEPHGVVVLPTGELVIVDASENAVLIAHF